MPDPMIESIARASSRQDGVYVAHRCAEITVRQVAWRMRSERPGP
jgi:hypothetical protein